MRVNENWPTIFSSMLTGATADPKAVCNLAMAQWTSIQRMMWGGSLPNHDDASGQVTILEASTSAGITRTGKLFVPDTTTEIHSLIVMIHGCMQDSDSFARLTGMSAIASEKGFAVLYPDQEIASNPMQCWNWYAPENLRRHGGEPEAMAKLIEQAQQKTGVAIERTHLAGISAGGAQTALMIHLYPDILSSAVIVAGPLPFAADSLPEALTEMSEGPSTEEAEAAEVLANEETALVQAMGKRIPVLIVHGEHDELVAFSNAEAQAEAVVALEDMLDNNVADGSIHAVKETRHSKSGDIDIWHDEKGKPLAVLIGPKTLGHAWSGGNLDEPFSQAGFDLSRLATDFFSAAESDNWSKFTLKTLAKTLSGT